MEKHPGGRPLKFGSPEELQARIDQYFSSCEGKLAIDSDGKPIIDKHGKPVIAGEKPPTITGLAHALGMTRRGFLNQIIDPLAHVNIRPNGVGQSLRDAAIVELAEVRLYEAIDDYLAPVNSSADLFKVRRPFASVRGRFYCFWVIGKIRDFIPVQK